MSPQQAEHFHPSFGRLGKELYAMAGLVFMMEFRNWTHNEVADAYIFNVDVQYALNLPPENQSFCRRNIGRYLVLFRDDCPAGTNKGDIRSGIHSSAHYASGERGTLVP